MSPSIPGIYRFLIPPPVMPVIRGKIFARHLPCSSACVPLYFHEGLPVTIMQYYMVCFAVELFPSPPLPASPTARGRFRWVIGLGNRVCASFSCITHVTWVYTQTIRGVGVGSEEPHPRLTVYFVEQEFSRISHISAHSAHRSELVSWYCLEIAVISNYLC